MAFLLALIAMVFGVIGFMVSFSPKVRGGIVSILSMLIAAVAIVIAIFKAIF